MLLLCVLRRHATRYEKTAAMFAGMMTLSCIWTYIAI
jgi:hypothetical protein